jgi:tetratricopeptide (TPR) repeat protein
MRKAFCLFFFLATIPLHGLEPIEVAVQEQNAASSASTQQEKQRLLNSALTVYLGYAQDRPSGMLLSNIGSVYFSLGEFGAAIAYYQQAHSLLPRDRSIQQNLRIAATQASVEHLQQEHPMTELFGLRWCSPDERSALAIGAIVFCFIFYSLNLWLPFVGFRLIWRIAAICTALLLSSLAWYTLFVPQRAVVLHATPLRPSPEASAAEPGLPTIRAGEVVEVLESNPSFDATRVQTASEAVGYIPRNNIYFVSPN